MPQLLARYENKYLVPRSSVDGIREVARSFCLPDAYGQDGCYEVNSLYCDTEDFRTARDTMCGQKIRFKARMRTYGFEPDQPVYLELKRRVGTTIVKGRALVSRDVARGIATDTPPPPEGYQALKVGHETDMLDYRAVHDAIGLRPACWVRYRREAWASAFPDGARLTFDTYLESQPPEYDRLFEPDPLEWVAVSWDGPPVVLELKFNGAYPKWMRHIVQAWRLQRISFPKYVQSLNAVTNLPWGRSEHAQRGVLL